MYIKRAISDIVMETSKVFPVVMLVGPRQVGKTTLLNRLSEENRKYVSLDDITVRDLAKNEPRLFLERYSPPVMIDEIQYAPELFPYIKLYVDENQGKGDFWITGSQQFQLMKNVSESLAGRVAVLNISSLSDREIKGLSSSPYDTDINRLLGEDFVKSSLKDVFKRIYTGSMPALYNMPQDIDIFYSSYVTTYIERDIRELTQVADTLSFNRFMTACAARTGQVVNYADLARDVDISEPTAKKWLSILVTSGIVYLLTPYYNNLLKRVIKSPKLYFMDTGLARYLTKWDSQDSLEASSMSGAFLETYVVSEIVKSYYNSGKIPPLFYYRDIDKKEIDLIIEKNNTLYPIEIKKTGNPKKSDISSFSVLEKTGKDVGYGNLICFVDDIIPLDEKNASVPVGRV